MKIQPPATSAPGGGTCVRRAGVSMGAYSVDRVLETVTRVAPAGTVIRRYA